MNVWLDWRPEDADELPAAARAKLSTKAGKLDFGRERRIRALPVATGAAKPRAWSFEAGSHPTRVQLRLPGRLDDDAPDACVLFQENQGGPALVDVTPK